MVIFFAPDKAPMQSRSPRRRLWGARAWLHAPLWVPGLLLSAATLPGLAGALTQAGDHCLAHATNHHHLCLLHPPHPAAHLLTWALPLLLLVPAIVVVGLAIRQIWREWRLARALVAVSRPSGLGPDVRLLEQSDPVALTVGWRRNTILLSRGLVDKLSTRALAVVLAHERAHVRRRDTLLSLCDRLAASVLPSAVALPLLEQITLAREQLCDAMAASEVDGELAVAEALTEVLRLELQVPATGVSVAAGSLEARVLYLLHPSRDELRALLPLILLTAGLLVAGVGPAHAAIEHLISFLLH